MKTSHSNTSLSTAQKRIWFECQSKENTLHNHTVLTYELRGNLSLSILQQALSQLVAENDIFRTTIFSSGKNLERFVHDHMKVELKCLSLEPDTDLYPTIQHLVKKPFNITTGPLFRFFLLQKSTTENILLLVFHRIIINTCVLKKIVQEISQHYQAIFQDKTSLVGKKNSYDDLVNYEKKYREEPHYQKTIQHWSNRIKDKQFHLDLTKLPELEESSSQACSQRIKLNEHLNRKISTLCTELSCTPENLFLTTLQILLYRYTDNINVVINRPEEITYQAKWENLLGPTGNIIPWNVQLEEKMNFLELIIQNQQFDRYKKYYPNAHITDIVRAVRSRFNHHFDGFFSNISFEREPIPFHEFILPNITIRALPQYIHRTRQEELQVFFDEHNQHFYLSFDYVSKFSTRAIQQFAEHYQNLLANLLDNPYQSITQILFLSQDTLLKLVGKPIDINPDYPDIVTLFEKAAHTYPKNTAIIDDLTSLTYQQLNEAANQLAHSLKAHGVKTDDCIGLAIGRNVQMVIATLGILKAGAAYVPLDPGYPRERLAYMIQDANISLVITEKTVEAFIQSCHPVKSLLLDESKKFPINNKPLPKPALSDLAYVIYTSGSTGKPKGVLVPHRGLPNLAQYQQQLFSLKPRTKCLQAGSINFDITAFELFAPLIFGGCLYIANEEQRHSPLKLQAFIIEKKIEVVVTTPSVLSHFEWIAMPDMRVITVCGEACEQKLMDFWAHGRTFINGYGPTEITMGSHFKVYEPNTSFNNLGSVAPNVSAFILDTHKNLLPDGVPGELYVGGVGVARGYLNLPEQTSEKFIINPFDQFSRTFSRACPQSAYLEEKPMNFEDRSAAYTQVCEQRTTENHGFIPREVGVRTRSSILYRTNDIAYRLENGDFIYLGRNDDQIKIRGLRVELGEIEAKINAYPSIERVLVRALSHETLGKILAAYFIQDSLKKPIEENALRDYLHACLPEHMVPTYLIKVPRFPIMRNGKIDYQALPNPFSSSEHFDHEQCNKIEQILIQIFVELFKMDEKSISLDHDFFALGGHSLLATQMIARIQQQLKLQLPVSKVFELRTIKKFAEYLSTLQKEDDALLLISIPKNQPIPLSYSQRLLWFFFQLDKHSPLYNIPFLIRFKKANREHLIRAFHHVIEQNAVLRTIFEETDDEPIQLILPSLDFKIPVYESSDAFFSDIEHWDKTAFDLLQGPLFRAAITQENNDLLLYFNIHHIIFDGWSFKVFMQQLANTYQAIEAKNTLPSLATNYSYADFIYSQRQWVKEEKLSKELTYWQHLLQGATTSLDLPTDFPYPKQQKYTGNAINIDLPVRLANSLKSLALENQTTLFSVLLTAYFILFYRYTKQSDILIGTPIANRFQADLEPIMGFLVNVSLYRQQLSHTKTFHELLQSVHQNACDAADNQSLPFDVLLNSLDILFDPKQNPLFQVMFSLQTGHQLAGKLGDTHVHYRVEERHAGGAKADMLMALNEMPDGSLYGYVEYRTDLFTEASILHLRTHYQNLLQAIIDNPNATLAELTILSHEEYEYLVKIWPYGEKKPYPTETVLEQIEKTVNQCGELPALNFHNKSLSYKAFWQKVIALSEDIKNHLPQEKPTYFKEEAIIGILLPRGQEMIIAMCAIWKAGSAFLPLDADYPEERIRYMLEDSGAKMVISNHVIEKHLFKKKSPLCSLLKEGAANLFFVKTAFDKKTTLVEKEEYNANAYSKQLLAYIIYTSGSTGNPKGVALEHVGLSNVINYVVDLYNLQRGTRVLQFTSINFDASIKEIFSGLVTGSCLYIADSEMRRSPEKLQAFIEKQKIQLASLQPVVLESFEKKPIPGLEIIDVGGDACDPHTINFWQNHCRLLNTYGPTETTIICSTKHYNEPVVTQNIGRPLYNTEIFILDEELNPVPTGVIGELFVGGICLARGYWHKEELTLEKFILHPFSDNPNARLYRTGDYARWLPNGELDFIGRIDNQVKIRGYRIETGEIETLLNGHPFIKQAVVIAQKEQQILVAYFTSRQEIDSETLRQYLAETLPEYMIPSAFIFMETLPLNLSGKIDRKALQAQDFRHLNLVRSFVEPANEMEKTLCDIWKEVLKIDELGVENSFFELGGHSLSVTQMISRIKKHLKLTLPITQVFELRTIRRIADYLLPLQEESKESLTLWHAPKKNCAPLSYAQKQMWFLYQLDPTSVVYNIPMLMRFEHADTELLVKALYHIIEENAVFKTVIDNTNDEPLQVILKRVPINIPIYDSLSLFTSAIDQWDATPFDLVNGPIFRVAFAKEKEDTLVYFNIHHIAFDGWSTNLLLEQWMSSYDALVQKKTLPDTHTEYQYIDYAYSQNRWLETNQLAEQRDFWQKFLHGAQTTLDLPTDFPYPETQTFKGSLIEFSLSSSLVKALKDLAIANNTTLSVVLLAGFFTLLYRYTKQSDIIVGVPIAGRYQSALEPIMGFFINESIYRQQLSAHQSFQSLLKSIHQNSCDAADNQALPFNEILDSLNIPVDPKRNPLFQVLFDYQAVLPSGKNRSHALRYSFEERNHNTAKLDLTLSMAETDQNCIQGGIEYRTDVFTEISIQHLCRHYQHLLQEIIQNPAAPLVSFNILSPSEYQLLSHTWARGKQKPLPEKTILEMVEDTIKKYPNTPALIFKDTLITYQILGEKIITLANLIKCRLSTVYPTIFEPIIGILMPRGTGMIISMCAIWKAGAAFLPLDADYPDDRLKYMIEDSDTHIIVSTRALQEKQNIFNSQHIHFIQADSIETEPPSKQKQEYPSLHSLAYIIYTSGSTGKPKGVLLEHLGLSNIIQSICDLYHLKSDTHVLQFSSINFDASMGEIFATLISGASLYIADNDTRHSPEKLRHFIEKNRIQIASLQPAILESFEKKPIKGLEIIDIGGDACDLNTINFWRNHCCLFNTYGPTEATIICAAKHYNTPTIAQNIGHPLYNTEIFIVDEYANPVPTGVIGEIFIGGAGLARGYLHREDLTQERFVPHFFSKDHNRLYRTGDYGRWLTNGEIQFIGRIDNQVKIRGYRIEMGEIESLLNRHPCIKQAIVIPQKELQILVAYFTYREEISKEQLRQYLAETLPEYMLPSAFIPLDALPLNLSGKIDRKALQSKDFRLFASIDAFVKPTNDTEESLWSIWKEILKTEQFGIDNSFFELGGHSLLITQMISRVKKQIKVNLSIAKVFELLTIRKIAQYLLTLQEEIKDNLVLWHAPDKNKAPLSYAQKQMWFFYQLNPTSGVYNIPMLFRFKRANQSLLIQSIYHIINQNPIFHTVIDNTEEEPVQIRLKNQDIHFPVYESLSRFYSDTHQWDNTSFDLVNGPIFRIALAQDGEDTLVYFNIHHIAFDGWSTNIFLHQLNTTYTALEKQQPTPDFSTQYTYQDYAYSQGRWLTENRLKEQSAFWQHFLQDAQTTLDLPTDFPYPQEQTFNGKTIHFSLSSQIVHSLRQLAVDNKTTLFSVTLTAFFILLYRYTKQTDIIIGSPIAGRYHPALESVVGFFVNESLYRQQLSNTKTFRELLASVHQNACDAADNQALPFNKILDTLNLPIDPTKNPLFQVLFNYLGTEGIVDTHNANATSALEYQFEERSHQGAKLDITLSIGEMPDGSIQGGVEYRTDLFTELSIQHLCTHYQNLLQEIISTPNSPLNAYRILSENEYNILVHKWPYGEKKPLPKETVLNLIEKAAKKYASMPALIFNDISLTYAEFWARVENLANRLLAESRPQQLPLIGLLMPRGIDMIIAICSVWKIGGAFIPLDADYPDERLQYMVEDSDTHIILSVSTLEKKQAIFKGRTITFIQADTENHGFIPIEAELRTRANSLAYVIYTSGSTGNPKGVAIKHPGLSNLVSYLQHLYDLEKGMKVLQFTSINFDVSIAEILPCLISGASLYIVDTQTRQSPPDLQRYIDQKEIQVVSIPPAVLEHFEKKSFPHVKTMIIGGDTCSLATINYWKKHCRLINGYGPTETTVYALTKVFKENTLPQTIGRPLYNTEAFILDEALQPVPTGVMGELFIGGIGLAQGYLNRQDLTAEKFIPHPFSKKPKAKLYRSGDYARWLPNGEIEFIGRMDNQVKIRGYRIEMGEIESLLNEHPTIKQVAIIPQKEQQMLVAYFSKNAEVETADLRNYLIKKLPDYMIPAAFIEMDDLPLSLSGKIDRKALQNKDFRLLNHVQTFIKPNNTIEQTLWNVWKEIFKTEKFGIDNSFFDLGGHSLLITQMLSRIKKTLKLNLSIASIFEHKTIRNIAKYLLTLQEERQEKLSLVHSPYRNKAPLSYAQKQMWFFYQLNPFSSTYHMPIIMRFKNARTDLLEKTLRHIIEQTPIFRTIIEDTGTEPQQIIVDNINVSIPLYNMTVQFYKEAKQWDLAPFDLVNGPVFRVALAQDNNDALLYFNIHHIAFDGWSSNILQYQITQTYQALEKNDIPPTFKKEFEYIDYAYSQTQWIESNLLSDQLSFWQSFLKDAQTTLDLPTDFPYPQEQKFIGKTIQFNLDESIRQKLTLLAHHHKTTLFSVTLAAFFVLLHRYTKQEDIIIGAPIAGRYTLSLEPIIGFFVNESIYRQALSHSKTFIELLKSVHQNACDAADNQTLPFSKIIDNLNIPIDLKKNPLFQVMFDYQTLNPDFDQNNKNQLDISIEERVLTTSKLDITLSLGETTNNGIIGSVEYRTDLFTELSIQHLCAHYKNLLQEILANPEAPLGSYQILSKPEYNQLVHQWPYGNNEPIPEKTVLTLLEENLPNYADSLALIFEENSLTYRELWEKIALLSEAIKPLLNKQSENIIGILMPRGIEMIIAMCSVWKAGSAFLPLDADYPDDRLNYMIEDSDTHIIVSVSELRQKQVLLKEKNITFIQTDKVLSKTLSGNAKNKLGVRVDNSTQSNAVNIRSLAYIIYTSGSTGNPKGVMLEHRGLSNVIEHMKRHYQFSHHVKKLQFASINFDNSILEIFFALYAGHTLYIANNTIRRSTPLLQEYLIKEKINFISIPPAVLESFAKIKMPDLEIIDCGGDTCDPLVIDYWKKQCLLVNGYGPTEATIISTSKIYDSAVTSRNIGRPLDNVNVFILDEFLYPVPTGVMGEIFIGGIGLARGYLHREELTKEKFIQHAFDDSKNTHLYRTGDYGRWLPNGDIEFVGRIDNQVKIRGYRIEMGEIESILNTYPGIEQAIVTAKKEQQILIAYFSGKKQIKQAQIRKYLVEKLPDYMIPSAFIHMDSLPLNLSGKIDRKLLANKEFRLTKTIKKMIKPRNKQEEQLLEIWKSVLNLEKISVEDSFFDLGGHSLSASKVSSIFKTLHHQECPVSAIFQYKTIAKIAENLETTIDQKSLMLADIQKGKHLFSKSIKPLQNTHYNPPKTILMTGAHGFLGAHILEKLLQDTQASIICLVRINATQKIKRQQQVTQKVTRDLARFNLESLAQHPRIQWIEGDLSQPMLGLSSQKYNMLCKTVDSIYHSGTWVNHILDYKNLRATNVDSTLSLLNMSITHHLKTLNYISTVSVKDIFEDPETLENSNGYVQSKWVSENILNAARNLGVPIRIFRPGNITGHSKTGICVAENNHALSVVKSCIQLGIAPNWEHSVEMMPVDYVSEAIVRYSLITTAQQSASTSQEKYIFNLNNIHTLPWKTYMHYLNKLGLKIQLISFADWQNKLKMIQEDNALFPFKDNYLEILPETTTEKLAPEEELIQDNDILKEVGLNYPQEYNALIKLYWTYLKKVGFLN